MAGLFGGGAAKVPQPAKIAPPPDRSNEDIQAGAEETRRRLYSASPGRLATMLTGGAGATTPSRAVRFLGDSGV